MIYFVFLHFLCISVLLHGMSVVETMPACSRAKTKHTIVICLHFLISWYRRGVFSSSLGCYSPKVLNSVFSSWFVSYCMMNKTKAKGSMIATHLQWQSSGVLNPLILMVQDLNSRIIQLNYPTG